MATLSVQASAEASTKTTIHAGGFTLTIDEPPLFGGEGAAPSPVEFLLASLAGCINAIGQWVAREMGFPLHKLDVDVSGEVDSGRFLKGDQSARAGFTKIHAMIRVQADTDEASLEAWARQVEDRCPVIDNLRDATLFTMAVQGTAARASEDMAPAAQTSEAQGT